MECSMNKGMGLSMEKRVVILGTKEDIRLVEVELPLVGVEVHMMKVELPMVGVGLNMEETKNHMMIDQICLTNNQE